MSFADYLLENYITNSNSFFYYQSEYFYCWFGFAVTFILVILMKIAEKLITRDENYYDEY